MTNSLVNLLVKPVLAQSQSVPAESVLAPSIPNVTDLKTLFNLITNVVLIVGASLVVVFLILAGIQYVTARGDTKQAQAARDSLTNAIIGLVIIMAAFTIRLVVFNILGGDDGGVSNYIPTATE